MDNLPTRANPKLAYSDPFKNLMSSVKIVSVLPTSAPAAGQACSSSDTIQFKLPSSGVVKCSSMYMKYDIITNSVGTGTTNGLAPVGAILDEHAPDASVFSRMTVTSSDGTQISDTNNYNTYCSVMNRLKNSRDESSTRGSIVRGEGMDMFEGGDDNGNTKINQFNITHGTDGGDAVAVNELASRFQDGAGRNYRLLSQLRNKEVYGCDSGAGTTVCHRFQSGLLDAEVGHMLPCFALGSGVQVSLNLADAKDALTLVGANAAAKLGAAGDQAEANTATYSLANISLVMEIQYFDSSVFSTINEALCEGIKLRIPRVRTQFNSLTSASNNIALAEHGRSINALVCGIRDTEKTGSFRHQNNDFVYKAGGKVIKNFQTQCGSEVIPSQSVQYGAGSFLELERAVGQGREGYRLGNKINAASYYKVSPDGGAGTAGSNLVSGDALFGVSFMSAPEMRDVMSGKSSSSGSIPLSLQLELDGTSAHSELFSIVMSDSIAELLHDGSVIVSR